MRGMDLARPTGITSALILYVIYGHMLLVIAIIVVTTMCFFIKMRCIFRKGNSVSVCYVPRRLVRVPKISELNFYTLMFIRKDKY